MRIAPLGDPERTVEHAAAARLLRPDRRGAPAPPWDMGAMPVNEWYDVVVRHPALVEAWWPLTTFFLAEGTLPVRQRELAVLRVSWRCRTPYPWKTHTVMARGLGLTVGDIERVRLGPDADGWSALDAAVLRAVDELHDRADITDSTWAVLQGEWDERQLIELPLLIGHYHMLAFVLNSLAVDVPGWDAAPSADRRPQPGRMSPASQPPSTTNSPPVQ